MTKILSTSSIIVLVSLVLAACGAPVQNQPEVPITVTLKDNVCTYAGPQTIPAGSEVSVNWVVMDTDKPAYMLTAFTLVNGKKVDDFVANIKGSGLPIGIVDIAGSSEMAAGGGSKVFQVRTTKGPLFFICVSNPTESTLQVLGPYQVEGASQ